MLPRFRVCSQSALESTDTLGISSVSLFELLHPTRHRKLDRQEKIVKSFIRQLRLLLLDVKAAEESA